MTPPMRVDLNADVGEIPDTASDAALMPQLTSASIACGVHAGSQERMRSTVELALLHRVAIGAHPGLADPGGFGRREIDATPGEVETLVVRQVYALAEIAAESGARVRHVKVHGALYNMAARDAALADAVARAVASVDRSLVLFGLAGSERVRAGERAGLRVASEGFADRAYDAEGFLVPRSQPGCVITDPHVVTAQALALVREQKIDSICVHGDTPNAANLASRVRQALIAAGFELRAIST